MERCRGGEMDGWCRVDRLDPVRLTPLSQLIPQNVVVLCRSLTHGMVHDYYFHCMLGVNISYQKIIYYHDHGHGRKHGNKHGT